MSKLKDIFLTNYQSQQDDKKNNFWASLDILAGPMNFDDLEGAKT